jgi:hypothetical protein
MIFLNQWINYTCTFTTTNATLIIDDFTSKTPVSLFYDFSSTPMNLAEVFNQTDNVADESDFNFSPYSLSALLKRVSYSYNYVYLFDFQMSENHFIHTSFPKSAV